MKVQEAKVKEHQCYDLASVGDRNRPRQTSSAADLMKPFPLGAEGETAMAECEADGDGFARWNQFEI